MTTIFHRRALALITLSCVALATPAVAHPHVWVAVESTVVYDKGAIVALRQRWAFDELYTSMAIQGLDTNNDGVYDRNELAELAKVNMDGLKEFGYFTVANLGQQALAYATPTDYFMEYAEAATLTLPGQATDPQAGGTGTATGTTSSTDTKSSVWSLLTNSMTGPGKAEKPKVLVLEFLLPLDKPVLAEAEGFSFSVADPSFFIWFDFANKDAVKLAGAPAGCTSAIASPQQNAFNAPAGVNDMNFSIGAARTVKISCPK